MERTVDDLAEEMVECIVHNSLYGRELEDYVIGFMTDPPEDARAMLVAIDRQRTGAYPVTVECDEDRYHAICAAIVRWEQPRPALRACGLCGGLGCRMCKMTGRYNPMRAKEAP